MTAAITIHFKKPKLTSACIDSLLADGWAPILVWDNSEDAGASLQELQTRYAAKPRVVLVTNPRNLGFGKGMNAALAALNKAGCTTNPQNIYWSGITATLENDLKRLNQ